MSSEGDGDVFYAASDSGKRVEKQWQGYTLDDWYAINPINGENCSPILKLGSRKYGT